MPRGGRCCGYITAVGPGQCRNRSLLDTEFLQAGGIGEFEQLVAVVIDMLDANMTETVDLAADPDPGLQDIVIIGGLARPKTGNAGLTRLDDGDLERAWRIGRRLGI